CYSLSRFSDAEKPLCLCKMKYMSPLFFPEKFEVLGPADPVVAVAGEDVVLPCYLKPNISAVDLHVEWFRVQTNNPLVHFYRDHEDRNEKQIPSYRGRTSLFPEELMKGNTSLKIKNVRGSDNGEYKCFIQAGDWYDDSSINVHIKGKNFERETNRFTCRLLQQQIKEMKETITNIPGELQYFIYS
uniref:Ig-like domain-containing protein n=1 Tax=Scleropages formosus TaxID=113540 RepID=A0A8C9R8K4_SCLFO